MVTHTLGSYRNGQPQPAANYDNVDDDDDEEEEETQADDGCDDGAEEVVSGLLSSLEALAQANANFMQ